MFVDRRRRSERPFLAWKVGLFSVAAVLTLVGIALEERWMTAIAIVVLLAALLLRFVPGGGISEGDEDEDVEEAEATEG